MRKKVTIHLIGNIIVFIISVLECYLFKEFNLLNIFKSVARNLIYYWIIIGSGLLLRKMIKQEIYMKTLLFVLFGVVGIILLSTGYKKDILLVKLFGGLLTITFVIMLISIFFQEAVYICLNKIIEKYYKEIYIYGTGRRRKYK